MIKVNDKPVINPRNFKSAPLVTTFIRSDGSRTKAVRQWLKRACKIDIDVKLAEMDHSSLK